ncbi:MAG: LysE family transporter [Bacteroidaceae bacterium]|nr:LysE family transporter [Bacteroidaceae bacterium]
MPLSLLPALLLQILVVGYTPGPANIYALTMGVKYGKTHAMRAWAGLFAGFTLAALVIVILTHFIGAVMGKYIVWLKYLGALYLFWLALKTWKSGMGKTDGRKSCSFLSGFVMQLTNAKMLLFELTVYSTFVLPYSNRISNLLELVPLLWVAGPVANLVWLEAGNGLRGLFNKYGEQIDLVAALALATCAFFVAIL